MQLAMRSAVLLAISAFEAVAEATLSGERIVELDARGGAELDGDAQDEASLFQQPFLVPRAAAPAPPPADEPFVIGLRRESVPVYRRGKIASYKTSYSGVLHVGTPAQEFRVVFDTGSGHVVLPAAECKSEACEVKGRRKFDMSASSTAVAVNTDGSVVADGAACDQVTIGFGTGEITGEFTRDRVCFGLPPSAERAAEDGAAAAAAGQLASGHMRGAAATSAQPLTQAVGAMASAAASAAASAVARAQGAVDEDHELCVEMHVVLAVEMSNQPFKTFQFDGILGLGLGSLALNKNFSAFDMLLGRGLPSGSFGVFLTEGEEGEESEIAFGGVDTRRMLEPALSWAPVMMPEHGHWMVQILAIRIGGKELDLCKDGTCRGVVDTGTSHLGIPAPADVEVGQLLTADAGDVFDCRLVDAPEVEIVLPGKTLTLQPHNYMRRLPLREGVSVSSSNGVHMPAQDGSKPAAAGAAPAAATGQAAADPEARRFCRPRVMPVRLPAPLGPKLFILGEPVLHRYYTVYDWVNQRVGFSLANSRRNTMDPQELVDRKGALPKEVDVLLMQQSLKVSKAPVGAEAQEPEETATVFMQVELKVSVRRRSRKA